jgi:hypothetical protein
MNNHILSVLYGILLSILWGISSWLKWQSMKKDTILPCGELTLKYGDKISPLLKIISLLILVFLAEGYIWWDYIVSVGIMIILGWWISTIIERSLYCNSLRLETIVLAAKEYSSNMSSEEAVELMSIVVPQWWIKIMPHNWQKELRSKLEPILLSNKQSAG